MNGTPKLLTPGEWYRLINNLRDLVERYGQDNVTEGLKYTDPYTVLSQPYD